LSRLLNPWRILGALVLAALLALYILSRISTNEIMLVPDVAHPVAPLVHVQGAHPSTRGAVYFVDVEEQRASELDKLFPWLHSHASFLPAKFVIPPGTTDAEMQQVDQREMSQSQRIAAAVALQRLGYHVVAKPNGVLVNVIDLGTHAVGKLQPTDVIVAVNGTPTPTIDKLRSVLGGVRPGQSVALRILRGAHTLTENVQTIDDPAQPGHAIVGFEPMQSARIELPIRVSIDARGVGGPSAGLAFALEVMQQLGHDAVHGHRIAATGEIGLDGTVGSIGGVEQKTYGVRQAHVDTFLVPAGANARTARRFAGPVRIIPVRSFSQALHALATLPPAQ
jgi:PDZ domain-containing protein